MPISSTQVVQTLLANPVDLANVRSVTTPDVTYRDGKIHYVQFLEDTFGTSGTLGRPHAQ